MVTQMWTYPNTDDAGYGGSKTAKFTEEKLTANSASAQSSDHVMTCIL